TCSALRSSTRKSSPKSAPRSKRCWPRATSPPPPPRPPPGARGLRQQRRSSGLRLQRGDRRFPGVDREGDVLIGVGERDVVFRLALEDAALAQQEIEAAHQFGVAEQGAAIVAHRLLGEDDIEQR